MVDHAAWADGPAAHLILAEAESAARAAGAVIMALADDAGVKAKGAGPDVVTRADAASEALVLEHLSAAFPGHRIEGEEGGSVGPADSPWVWHCDPLDGTANFARGIPHWAVSVGLAWRGEPVLGVVHAPAGGMTLTAARGHGVWLDGVPLGPAEANAAEPRSWIVAVDWPWDLRERRRVNALITALAPVIRQYKTFGSAALDCVGLARGWVDAYAITDVFAWDLCAGCAALAELGYDLRDWQGQPWRLGRGPICAARPGMDVTLGPLLAAAWEA